MRVNVIRPFPFSKDGRTQEHAFKGEQDIPDALVPGLVAEGYVEQPEGLPLIPMSAGRRKVMVDRLTELFRAHMDALGDDELTWTLQRAERDTAERLDTKVVGDLEHGQAELFNGADPAAFDHDGDGKPGGSLRLDGLAAIADADLTKVPVAIEPLVEVHLTQGGTPVPFDPDTADEAALRAFLTARDGKEPDKRFGPDRLRALAKAAPAAEGASE